MGAAVRVPIPPSANHLWRIVRGVGRGKKPYSRIARTNVYEAWLHEAVLLIRLALPVVARYPVALEVVVRGGEGFDGKRRDLDNCLKAVQDAVKHAGRIREDTCACVNAVAMRYEPGGAGRAAECWVAIHEPAEAARAEENAH